MQRGETPYRELGARLRRLRQSLQETLPEVSGAIELETDTVASYERGELRPSADVLSLLITHFDINDDEADELWDLAGYANGGHPHDMPPIPNLVVVPMDTRVIYTDSAQVSANKLGVVMGFMQSNPQGQQVPVARVGMSLEHAKTLLDVLQQTINQAEKPALPKQLPHRANIRSNKKK